MQNISIHIMSKPFEKIPRNSAKCLSILALITFLYCIPILADFIPDTDSYLGGIGFLGIWGTIILTLAGIIVSMYYGLVCISTDTVYHCAGFGCEEADSNLVFPEGFPAKEKYKKALKGKYQGWKNAWWPFSDYMNTLKALNDVYLYEGEPHPKSVKLVKDVLGGEL